MSACVHDKQETLEAYYGQLLVLFGQNKLQLAEAIGRAWLESAFSPAMQITCAFALAALSEEGVACSAMGALFSNTLSPIERKTWLFLVKTMIEGKREVK